jgi:tRNA-2-methylthio-N6-dimethylallyladenosine synthase
MATVPELVSHLHLPVQSGSDRILAAMKRGHTVLWSINLKSANFGKSGPISAYRPISSWGFPARASADFEATMNLIDEIGFDTSFSFVYSARPGTPGRRSAG